MGFRVAGRVQLDHGKGPWDEWYLGFDDGRWGWLAKAQGDWYVTFPVDGAGPMPPWSEMWPGLQGNIPGGGDTPWTTGERGASLVLSAEGELPLVVRPGERGHYVDLHGPAGKFATIDYGDGTEPPRFYAGRRLAHTAIAWTVRGAGPRPEEKLSAQKLKCPQCGGPIDIFVPSETERACCPSCSALLDVNRGALQFLQQLEQPKVPATIPIGTRGTLRGVEC